MRSVATLPAQRPVHSMASDSWTKGSPEFELLVRCAQSQLDEADVPRIRTLVQNGIDWPILIQHGEFHGVQPMLFHNLLTEAADLVGEREGQMKRMMAGTAALVLFLSRELTRLTEALEGAGVPVLSFKGPLLAKTAYGAIQLRNFTDIDLLVRPEDFETVERVLREHNYKLYSKLASYSQVQKDRYIARTQQYPFIHGDGLFAVDVHVGIMPPLYYFPIDTATLWQRSIEVEILGRQVRTFEPEDMLLILCYHGEKNRWERLKNICDVAELVRSTPELDWDRFLGRVSLTRSERLVHLGLYLAQRLFRTELPAEIGRRIASDRQAIRLGELVLRELPHQAEIGTISFVKRMRFHLTLQKSPANKARYLFHALLRRVRSSDD